ncbi:MAG: dTDP-4-amino-4,6-dideoxygalactose transaminase [Prevotella sp.]|jgi:dTDP-4-amino-4,6-dideoxygalactose transaminase|nr:dTDP-4-amino-4,6-dideoxygalactose transaminase [Prevotella sp.]
MIPFNKPYFVGNELDYIGESFRKNKTCGNGVFTKLVEEFFLDNLKCRKCLMTSSCTDALEMCALLADISNGDEVILPSFTFVSTALAFARQGAKLVFADSRKDNPCIDENTIEALITPRTRAIVVVHYAGMACEMDTIMDIARRNNIIVIEDAAQAIASSYKGKPLGSIGHLAAFSFHETKNIQCGEGGLLCINDQRFVDRAEIIWEKGTNREAFFRGEVDKYSWVDIGSSFLPAEYVAAFLYAQLGKIDDIQGKRIALWNTYYEELKVLKKGVLPSIPNYAENNAHMFYLVCPSLNSRTDLISFLKKEGIQSAFHYQSLHLSSYVMKNYTETLHLPQSDRYSDCLLRLPLYYELSNNQVREIAHCVNYYFDKV